VCCEGWWLFWRPIKLICLYLLFCFFSGTIRRTFQTHHVKLQILRSKATFPFSGQKKYWIGKVFWVVPMYLSYSPLSSNLMYKYTYTEITDKGVRRKVAVFHHWSMRTHILTYSEVCFELRGTLWHVNIVSVRGHSQEAKDNHFISHPQLHPNLKLSL
jgi:hypothetical protein